MKTNQLKQFNKQKKVRSQVFLIIGAAVFIYMLIATVEAVWQNYKINTEIIKLKTEIVQLQKEGQELKNLIAYRGTESFKEREARRKLGYRKPYEQVLAIPQPSFDNTESGKAKDVKDIENNNLDNNFQKWWEYVFG